MMEDRHAKDHRGEEDAAEEEGADREEEEVKPSCNERYVPLLLDIGASTRARSCRRSHGRGRAQMMCRSRLRRSA